MVPPGLSNKSTLQSTFFVILRLLRPHLDAACSPSSLLGSFPAGHLFLQVNKMPFHLSGLCSSPPPSRDTGAGKLISGRSFVHSSRHMNGVVPTLSGR